MLRTLTRATADTYAGNFMTSGLVLREPTMTAIKPARKTSPNS
jgi:hypothetical protein